MYQGKFDKDTPEIPVQQEPAMEEVEFVRPVRRQRKKKKPIRTRTLVFWTCVLSFVLLAAIAICIGLGFLKDWLINFEYESTLPETKSQAVYDQLFADPQWETVYALSNTADTKFENSKAYATYMKNIVGDEELRLVKVSAGLSQNHKYEIRMGAKKLAAFTLLDSKTPDGKKDLVLGDVEIVYERKESCTVLTVPGATVKINGVALDSSYVIKTVKSNAPDYLPAGNRGYETVLYRVEDLMIAPEVTVTDASGAAIAMDYDKATKAYSHFIGSEEITDVEQGRLIDTTKIYCEYMIGKVGKTKLQQYFDASSQVYKTITGLDTWMQSYKSYRFGEATVTEYYRYSDTLYSARVKMTLYVTRKDAEQTEKEYPVYSTFIMENQDGVWKAIDMLNISIQDITTFVQLRYYDTDGKTLLHTEMVDATTKSLVPPPVIAPEGKQVGWSNRVNKFLVDENGNMAIPADYTLEPMNLYAVFSNKEA